jgi:hypothetical protein
MTLESETIFEMSFWTKVVRVYLEGIRRDVAHRPLIFSIPLLRIGISF